MGSWGGNINTVCRRWAVATVGSCCQWAVVVGCQLLPVGNCPVGQLLGGQMLCGQFLGGQMLAYPDYKWPLWGVN